MVIQIVPPLKAFVDWRCVCVHRVVRQWGGESVAYQEDAHWKHMQGDTFPECATPFHVCKITRANESTLGRSDFCPFSSQGLSHLLFFFCWLLNVPATCLCISGTDLINFTYWHTETEVADQTFYLTQSQYTDNGPTSPCTDPIMPGAWQGSHWSANFEVTGMTRPGKIWSQAGSEPWIFRSQGRRLSH